MSSIDSKIQEETAVETEETFTGEVDETEETIADEEPETVDETKPDPIEAYRKLQAENDRLKAEIGKWKVAEQAPQTQELVKPVKPIKPENYNTFAARNDEESDSFLYDQKIVEYSVKMAEYLDAKSEQIEKERQQEREQREQEKLQMAREAEWTGLFIKGGAKDVNEAKAVYNYVEKQFTAMSPEEKATALVNLYRSTKTKQPKTENTSETFAPAPGFTVSGGMEKYISRMQSYEAEEAEKRKGRRLL